MLTRNVPKFPDEYCYKCELGNLELKDAKSFEIDGRKGYAGVEVINRKITDKEFDKCKLGGFNGIIRLPSSIINEMDQEYQSSLNGPGTNTVESKLERDKVYSCELESNINPRYHTHKIVDGNKNGVIDRGEGFNIKTGGNYEVEDFAGRKGFRLEIPKDTKLIYGLEKGVEKLSLTNLGSKEATFVYGKLNEDGKYPEYKIKSGGSIIFNEGEVERINAPGFGNWIGWLYEYKSMGRAVFDLVKLTGKEEPLPDKLLPAVTGAGAEGTAAADPPAADPGTGEQNQQPRRPSNEQCDAAAHTGTIVPGC